LVIIPAYNEAWNIVPLIEDLKAKGDWDVLVVDDASTDFTGKLARKTNKAFVVTHPYNLGIGGAVQTGFKFAQSKNYQYVLQFDADGQHVVDEIPRLLKLVQLGKADVVVGSRFIKSHNGYKSSFLRRLGIKVFEWVGMLLIHQKIKDATSGFRAYNRKAIELLAKNYPVDYPEPEAIIILGKQNFKISEVFTEMKPRIDGTSSIAKKGVFYMFKVLLAMIMTYIRPKY